MGMATWHVPGLSHTVLPSDLLPVVGSCFSSGRIPASVRVQSCCCINRCLCHGLGSFGLYSSWALAQTYAELPAGQHLTRLQDFINLHVEPVSSVYLPQMASNTGTCSVSITLAAPFPSTDRIRALLLLLSPVPLGEPC